MLIKEFLKVWSELGCFDIARRNISGLTFHPKRVLLKSLQTIRSLLLLMRMFLLLLLMRVFLLLLYLCWMIKLILTFILCLCLTTSLNKTFWYHSNGNPTGRVALERLFRHIGNSSLWVEPDKSDTRLHFRVISTKTQKHMVHTWFLFIYLMLEFYMSFYNFFFLTIVYLDFFNQLIYYKQLFSIAVSWVFDSSEGTKPIYLYKKYPHMVVGRSVSLKRVNDNTSVFNERVFVWGKIMDRLTLEGNC